MTRPRCEFNPTPLAYHIIFRGYGTWLHGDSRGSVDRHHNRYGSPRIPQNTQWRKYNERSLKRPPVFLFPRRRVVITDSIKETCRIRRWRLWAVNVRSNHVHSVVTANCDPDIVLNALKANATRHMREKNCWSSEKTPWVRRGSKRRLWTQKQLDDKIAYVEYEQGEPLD